MNHESRISEDSLMDFMSIKYIFEPRRYISLFPDQRISWEIVVFTIVTFLVRASLQVAMGYDIFEKIRQYNVTYASISVGTKIFALFVLISLLLLVFVLGATVFILATNLILKFAQRKILFFKAFNILLYSFFWRHIVLIVYALIVRLIIRFSESPLSSAQLEHAQDRLLILGALLFYLVPLVMYIYGIRLSNQNKV